MSEDLYKDRCIDCDYELSDTIKVFKTAWRYRVDLQEWVVRMNRYRCLPCAQAHQNSYDFVARIEMLDEPGIGHLQVGKGGYDALLGREGHALTTPVSLVPTIERFLTPGQKAEVEIKLYDHYSIEYARSLRIGERLVFSEGSRPLAVGKVVGFSEPWVEWLGLGSSDLLLDP